MTKPPRTPLPAPALTAEERTAAHKLVVAQLAAKHANKPKRKHRAQISPKAPKTSKAPKESIESAKPMATSAAAPAKRPAPASVATPVTSPVAASVATTPASASVDASAKPRRTSIPKEKLAAMRARTLADIESKKQAALDPSARKAPAPAELHPRNRHQGRYDMPRLLRASSGLAKFVTKNPYGDLSIDFADPLAVKALNTALLVDWYGIQRWDFPQGFLCPPIPGRADYLHHVADLLATGDGHAGDQYIPRGWQIRVLDIGVGANGVYPLIGHGEYGWSFVGSDIHPAALTSLQGVLAANPDLSRHVELRRQTSPARIFTGVFDPEETFDLTMCNPPFHATAAEAHAGSQRKWRNLGKEDHAGKPGKSGPSLNFGGQASELWCQGGEVGFISRMIDDSTKFKDGCAWFTTLVAQEVHVAKLERKAKAAGAVTVRTIPMSQGQKRSRILAWTFFDQDELRDWREHRWTGK